LSRSCDQGHTWTEAEVSSVKNPDTKAHMLRWQMGDGRMGDGLLLAYNDHSSYKDVKCRKCRTKLTVSTSGDDGVTWKRLALVENAQQDLLRTHYPTILQVGCDRLVVIFSQAYACCAPKDAELGIRMATFKLAQE
ncbi:hypothetical protein CYMTET_29698, partial [Cymbomonas tetramitiformis]